MIFRLRKSHQMSFSEQWEAARYNQWYWISYATMFVIPIIGSTYVAFMLRRQTMLRRVSHVLLAIACGNLAAEACFRSVQQKWDARSAAAMTTEQQQTVAYRDGANLALASLSAPFCGAISIAIWITVAMYCGQIASRNQEKNRTE
jgi:hypothetical protein